MSYYFKIIKLFRKTFNRVEIKYLSSKSINKEERIKMNELNNISLTVLSNGFAGIITLSLSFTLTFYLFYSKGTPKSFALGISTQNYIFNIGEGTQRLTYESKFKINNTKNIFITRKSWVSRMNVWG